MSLDTKFGSIWLPSINNLLYVTDANGLVIGMEFFDKYDATAAYEEYAKEWDKTKSVNITFVEGRTSYDAICYQDPKRSHSRKNMCLYKDSLGRAGLFMNARGQILEKGCRVSLYYKDAGRYRRMGMPLDADARIVSEKDVAPGSYEDVIRRS